MKRLSLLYVLLVFYVTTAHAEFTGKVVGVIDGDTIDVLHDGVAERVRLNGIDCPEKRQAFGTEGQGIYVRNGVRNRGEGHGQPSRFSGVKRMHSNVLLPHDNLYKVINICSPILKLRNEKSALYLSGVYCAVAGCRICNIASLTMACAEERLAPSR